jgi:arsenate reductase
LENQEASLVIQIFGTKKCRDSRKAERYFKERRITIQYIDLAQKAISQGELNSIRRSIPLEELIDRESKRYEARNLAYLVHNVEEELLAEPLLFRTPIVRAGQKATVGHCPEIWSEWLKIL